MKSKNDLIVKEFEFWFEEHTEMSEKDYENAIYSAEMKFKEQREENGKNDWENPKYYRTETF